MKILIIRDPYHQPIATASYGLGRAYLQGTNNAYVANDETETPSMEGADCVARMLERLEAAGFQNVEKLVENNHDLLKALEAGEKLTSAYSSEDAETFAAHLSDYIFDLRMAINKARAT
jgi:hypothetical protein